MADERFARLPDQVTLKRDDVAMLLFALDIVEQHAAGEAEAAKVRQAVVLLTRKLWPELGDLLDDDK
jgi:hypothetical protein